MHHVGLAGLLELENALCSIPLQSQSFFRYCETQPGVSASLASEPPIDANLPRGLGQAQQAQQAVLAQRHLRAHAHVFQHSTVLSSSTSSGRRVRDFVCIWLDIVLGSLSVVGRRITIYL